MMQPRREFLKMALGASATPMLLAQGRTGPDGNQTGTRLPIPSTGSKIKSIETFTSGSLSIVRVRTDSGQEGYGQIAPFNADISATVLHRKVAPQALGEDPAALDAISDRCVEANYKFPWSFVCRALAGLDTALWDLHGKTAGKSVCELLGGKPRPLPVYGSSMRRDIKPEDEAARLAACAMRRATAPSRSASARSAATTRTSGPDERRSWSRPSARRSATTSPCWSTAKLLHAPQGHRSGQDARAERRRPLRGALPLLGTGVDRPGGGGARRPRGRRGAGQRPGPVAAHDRTCTRWTSSSRTSATSAA